jgi:hypothetical protein
MNNNNISNISFNNNSNENSYKYKSNMVTPMMSLLNNKNIFTKNNDTLIPWIILLFIIFLIIII